MYKSRNCPSPSSELRPSETKEVDMVALGVVLLILGFVFGIHLLWVLGIILLVIGAVIWVMGSMGRSVAGRRHWY
jgi:Family of unknown function (DUF6131)